MFQPRFTITHQLLEHIKQIAVLRQQLNSRQFPSLVLADFEKTAEAVSAYASTSIEGNPLPLTEVKNILKSRPAQIRTSEQEVLNYNQALQELNQRLQTGSSRLPLTLELILRIHGQVTAGLLPQSESGHLRKMPVVVNDPKSRSIVFLPPNVEEVQPLLEDLLRYIQESHGHIDPLILAGILHKQMVLIHPFTDGNGRTTRLATKVLLAQMGLDAFNLFSFENYYNQNVSRYFQMVGEFGDYYELRGEIDFTPWLEYFMAGIVYELQRVQGLLADVVEKAVVDRPDTAQMVPYLRQLAPHEQILMTYVQKHGYITDKIYAGLVDRAKATRTKDFRRLLDLGLLERRGKARATYYVVKWPQDARET